VANQFEGQYRFNFYLAPPALSKKDRATGKPGKRKFPGLMLGLFSLLAPLKFLRGTPFDLFGYTADRAEERKTLAEFRVIFAGLRDELTPDNYRTAVEIAKLPMHVRGYGHVKSESLAAVSIRKDILMKQHRGELVPLGRPAAQAQTIELEAIK